MIHGREDHHRRRTEDSGNAKPPAPSNPLNSANLTASKQHGNVSNRMMPAGYET